MNPIEFDEQTAVIAKNQPEYVPLPSYVHQDDVEGKVVFCWELSAEEVARVIETRKIWHTVLTFNAPLQPQMLQVEKPEMPAHGHPKRRRIRPDEETMNAKPQSHEDAEHGPALPQEGAKDTKNQGADS